MGPDYHPRRIAYALCRPMTAQYAKEKGFFADAREQL